MNAPSREDAGSPAPLRTAPDGASTPLPAGFGLNPDPATTTMNGGAVLLGGSPTRLLRLSARAQALVGRWTAGERVSDRPAEQRLARRLVSSGLFVPVTRSPSHQLSDVTVVIPVQDRPEPLERLLSALPGLHCVVVDDASVDPQRTEDIARRAGAEFIALPANVGPGGARNAGLRHAKTPLVAFVDSDCVPTAGWLSALLGAFDDPLVAAVAPRVIPTPASSPSIWSSYAAVRSSLDLGRHPGLVRRQSKISYVPSAALIARRELATGPFFDPSLRSGEDVDLVWRLAEAGWDVRYVPTGVVQHDDPAQAREWLGRRFFYGTSAGPLARRHPGALAPLQTSAWTAGVWALLLARRPVLGAGALAGSIVVLRRRLDGVVDEPLRTAGIIAGGGTLRSTLPALAGLTRAWSPGLAVALLFRRTRRIATWAFLLPALADWFGGGGELNPVDYSALHVADDLAYGSGVWVGCLRARTLRPLVPRIALRSRTWSARTLTSQREDGPT